MANITDGLGNAVGVGNIARGAASLAGQLQKAANAKSSVDPAASVAQFAGSENIKGLASGAKQRVQDFVSSTGFGKALRGLNLLPDAEPEDFEFVSATSSNENPDWRVKLSLPKNYERFAGPGAILSPLVESGGLVWPYTPQIYITHSASYSPIQPVHSNYPFFAYQNSRIDQFSIVGDFYVENNYEGAYWIAAIHYLRSITKMSYGETSNVGSPPPVVRLNGYGDYVFKDVPVVITSFAVELNQDVDYIKVPGYGDNGAWVPTRSNIQATVQPIYSRRAVESFSLDQFVKGGYIGRGGFI